MANPRHVKFLKQGVIQWNEWRKQHPQVQPNLFVADLSGADLREADLRGANLTKANLSKVVLREADLRGANLIEANLIGADLWAANLREAELSRAQCTEADLSRADLWAARLREARLTRAELIVANLTAADLSGADLSGAHLVEANLDGANLVEANLTEARLWKTIFTNLDLRTVKGLVEIRHEGPSPVALHTVLLPQNGSALHFLRGTGVPNEWIALYQSTMLYPIQYHSCFISYCSKDEALARRLHADLQDQGVRCWFAPEDMKIGDKIRPRIEEAIHLQDKLLLLLSEHAIQSSWVEDEVEAALEKERGQQRLVLFPVRLDEQVMQTTHSWAAKLRRTRHIGDFTHWTDPQLYQLAIKRLLADLKAETEKIVEMEGKIDGEPFYHRY